MYKLLFNLAGRVPKFSLKGLFKGSAKVASTGAVSAAVVAPEATGKFIGGRIASIFNGAAKGFWNKLIESPVLMAAGGLGLGLVAINVWNKLTR